MSISQTPWTVREGRSTRYLYIVDAEGTKIAELDLWTATAEDAVLMAAAPQLLDALQALVCEWPESSNAIVDEAEAVIATAETPFVQGYKPVVSQE